MANGLFGGGDGTKGNPYLIEDAEDLNAIRNIEANHYFKQVSDIDLSSYNWVSLGSNQSEVFYSSYDGNNFIIDNLAMSGNGHEVGGLFGHCVTETDGDAKNRLENITLTNVSIELPTTFRVGMLATSLINMDVFNCHTQGTLTGQSNVGGFAQSLEDSIINKCSINGAISGIYVGGFTCYMTDSTVNDCFVKSDIYGTNADYVALGGFGYQTYSGNINNCYIIVNMVSGADTSMYLYSDVFNTTYESCYVDITKGITDMSWVEGKDYFGEVFIRGTDNNLYKNIQQQPAEDYGYWEDAWNTTGPPAWWPGPMYRARPTSGADWQEYWEIITPSTREGARYTTQMKQQSNYIGWDFETIWGIDPNINNGYPYLRSLKAKNINMYAKVGGVWIKSTDVYAKRNGVWGKALEVFGKSGTWNKSE